MLREVWALRNQRLDPREIFKAQHFGILCPETMGPSFVFELAGQGNQSTLLDDYPNIGWCGLAYDRVVLI